MKTGVTVLAQQAAMLVLTVATGTCWAQYKCTGTDGRVSFQQLPCPASASTQKLTIKPAAGVPADAGPAAPPASGTSEMQWVRSMERERKIKEQQQRIAETQATIDRRNRQMQQEMATIRDQKAMAKNNLAGATWEQSLSTEMQAVAAKYQALNEADQARIKQMQTELEQMQRAP